MYCVECRESGRFPWDHAADCVAGLREMLRLYEIGFGLLLVAIILETVLLVVAFVKVGACT
jgi:hypothetical protein